MLKINIYFFDVHISCTLSSVSCVMMVRLSTCPVSRTPGLSRMYQKDRHLVSPSYSIMLELDSTASLAPSPSKLDAIIIQAEGCEKILSLIKLASDYEVSGLLLLLPRWSDCGPMLVISSILLLLHFQAAPLSTSQMHSLVSKSQKSSGVLVTYFTALIFSTNKISIYWIDKMRPPIQFFT